MAGALRLYALADEVRERHAIRLVRFTEVLEPVLAEARSAAR